MINREIAQAMYFSAKQKGSFKRRFSDLGLVLKLNNNQWTLEIWHQGSPVTDQDEAKIQTAFEIPEAARWSRDTRSSKQDGRPLADDPGRWYIVRLEWPDAPVQETMFDTKPLDGAEYYRGSTKV